MMGIVRGVIALSLFAAFIALCIWAWSARRRPLFDYMARMALDEEEAGGPRPAPHDAGKRRAGERS
ncbi:MAG TPA: hypothetical protein VME42_19190 [Steroidobacteraceae bacterium]|nr:hypothetical protein [Steroidobacteraceae bacterium]